MPMNSTLTEEQLKKFERWAFSVKDSEPKNNDGQYWCLWCGEATEKVYTGFGASAYDICPECKK